MSDPQIPGYIIREKLGKGGMATVYLAIQEAFERDVALKVMSLDLIEDPVFRERFVREAKIVANLSHHNIVTVYDAGVFQNIHYIAMEYHPGGDLKHRARHRLSPLDALQITCDIASGLDYAHAKGFVHRDIKPDNILFRQDGSAVLTDFGIAKSHNAVTHLTRMGIVAGTPKYMSPEQARGKPLDGRADIYSLGIVFYEMLTGRVPFYAEDSIALGIMHMQDPVPPLVKSLSDFQPVIDRMLAKDPDDRFSSAAEVIAALEPLKGKVARLEETSQSVGEAKGGKRQEVRAKNKRFRLPLVAGLALLAAVAGGIWLQPSLNMTPVDRINQSLTEESPAAGRENKELNALVARAQEALVARKLVSPPGDNAYEYYRQALEMDPQNPEVLQGIQQIAGRLLTLSEVAAEKGDLLSAQEYLQTVSTIAPSHPYLADAQKALDSAIAEAEKARLEAFDRSTRWRIAGLLTRAEDYVEDGALIQPEGGSALDQYKTVLSLDPDNLAAKKGIRRLGDLVIADVIQEVESGHLTEAEFKLHKIKEAVPSHPELAWARYQLEKARRR